MSTQSLGHRPRCNCIGPDVGGEHGPYRQSERKEIYQEHVDRCGFHSHGCLSSQGEGS